MTDRKMQREGGFTMISVLLAIIMLSVGLIALTRSQTILMVTQSQLANTNTALQIARGYLEQVRGRDPLTLAAEPAIKVDNLGLPSVTGAYNRSMTVTDDAANLARVTVTVTYPKQTAPVQLVTLIYRGTAP
jgi:type IV pilus assembly protein PilV